MSGPIIERTSVRTFTLLLSVVAFTVSSAYGEWSNDPANPLRVASLPNDQVQPKISPTSDSGCYVSWFDNYTGGYDVYLQRLDPQGKPVWPGNGILIADRSYGWTMDYDLVTDADDNAVIVFNDDRSGVSQINATKVAKDGSFLWGPRGVQVSAVSASDFIGPPYVAATSDGNYVVAWLQNSSTVLQKLNSSGVPQWGVAGVTETPSTGYYSPSDLVAAENGRVIVSLIKSGSSSDPRRIHTQKYTPTGQRLWGLTPVIVMTLNSLQMGNFPSIVYDGNGGALYSWYDVPTGAYQVHVQHLNASGIALFPANGAVGATTAGHLRVSPSIAYDRTSNVTYMFWTDSNSLQSQFGLYGQKFNATGVRQWTDAGKVFVAQSGNQVWGITALSYLDSAMVFYFDRGGAAYVRGMRVDPSGNYVWTGSPIVICSMLTSKGDLEAAQTTSGMALLAWADGAVGSQDILAQNVNPDGTIGQPIFLHGDMNCDGRINGSDINGFVLALIDPSGYSAAYPTCRRMHADCNYNGVVDVSDINAFVTLLLED